MEWFYFAGPWSREYQVVVPQICERAKAHGIEVQLVRLDTHRGVELANHYQVTVLPTLVVANNGRVSRRMAGSAIIQELTAFLETWCPHPSTDAGAGNGRG